MPVTFTIDNQSRMAQIAIREKLSFGGVEHIIKYFFEGPPALNMLWDFSAATEVDLSTEEEQQLAEMLRQAGGGGKTALLSPSDTVFGLSRMLEILLDAAGESRSLDIKVFRDKEAAVKWLKEGK